MAAGDGEPTVTQTVHDELQAELDAALANLTTSQAEATRLEGELTTSQTEATRLRVELETSQAEATRLEGELTTSQAEATRLEGELETSQTEATRLEGELETSQTEVDELTTLIGDETDVADITGSLNAQLNAANNEVAALKARIGAATDAANSSTAASLYARLNAATTEATRLQGELRTANRRVAELTTLVGDPINPTASSLRGMLATARASVTRLTGERDAARASVTALTSQLTTAQANEAAAQQRAAQAAANAQAEIQRHIREQAQGLEGSQRAQNLRAAFPGGTAAVGMFPTTTAPNAPLTMMQNRGSLSITRGGHTAGAISGSQGLRSTTLTLTTGGDTGKTVVYTDHETSRPLLAHFGTQRDPADMTQFLVSTPAGSPILLMATIPHFLHRSHKSPVVENSPQRRDKRDRRND